MELTTEQFDVLKEEFKTLKDRSPFYAKKFEGIDLSDVQTQEDFEKLPFSEKADMRDVYPLGLAAVFLLLFLTLKKTLPIGLFSLRVVMR